MSELYRITPNGKTEMLNFFPFLHEPNELEIHYDTGVRDYTFNGEKWVSGEQKELEEWLCPTKYVRNVEKE